MPLTVGSINADETPIALKLKEARAVVSDVFNKEGINVLPLQFMAGDIDTTMVVMFALEKNLMQDVDGGELSRKIAKIKTYLEDVVMTESDSLLQKMADMRETLNEAAAAMEEEGYFKQTGQNWAETAQNVIQAVP